MLRPSQGQRLFAQLLPSTTAILLLTALVGSASAHALPRQTKTIGYHEINAVAWPPLPTEAPKSPLDLFRRQEENTVCGYLGGDSALPATCSAGSHCVLDTDNQVIGCCPNGGSCTAGVFTGCVDRNSGPQTEINPYIFTCPASDVCYMNVYQGGFSQYGCGSASNLATTIATTADGISTTLDLIETSVEKTEQPSSLEEPTTIGTPDSTSKTTTTTPPSSTDTSTTTTTGNSPPTTTTTENPTDDSSTTTTPSSTTTSSGNGASTDEPSNNPGPAPVHSHEDDAQRIGAIVGGTIGGVAIIVILLALFIFMRKRRGGGGRQSPGIGPIGPPMTQYRGPGPVHGAAFAPLSSWHEEDEQHYYNQPYNPGGYYDSHGQPTTVRTVDGSGPDQSHQLHYHPAHVPGVGSGLAPVAEEHSDSEPSLQEIDDFSRAYSAAGIGTVDEDRIPLTPTTGPYDDRDPHSSSGDSVDVGAFPSPPSRGQRGSRPLWQQNRQQSRNLMWQ